MAQGSPLPLISGTRTAELIPQPPYSDAARGIVIQQLASGRWYAFDYRRPSGVVLLSPRGADRLSELLRGDSATDSTLDAALAHAGLSPEPTEPNAQGGNRSLSVWIQLVNVCNFGCYYCYVPQLGKNVGPSLVDARTMATDDFTVVLDRLLHYCREVGLSELHLRFAGGEPSLNLSRLESFCEMAKAKEMPALRVSFGMISNGSFNIEAIEPILGAYDVELSLSIDGYGTSHDRIRFERDCGQKVGSWARVSSNALALAAAGRPPYLLYTVTHANYQDIDRFANFAHDAGMGYRLSLVRSPRMVPESQQLEILATLIEHYTRLGRVLSPEKPISRFARFAEWNLLKKKTLACSSCRNCFAVGQHGEVSSCQMTLDQPLGQLRTNSFSDIVARARSRGDTRALAIPTDRQGVCSRCTYFHVCAGGCPQDTISVYGTEAVPSAWCKVFGGLVPVYVEAIANQMERRRGYLLASPS